MPSVTLADGSQIKVWGIKQTHPLLQLSLNFVLYVPGYPFNIIFISKLTRTFDFSVIYVNNFVLILDQCTRQTIRAGHEFGGLYQLTPPIAYVSYASPTFTHECLGHPSLEKLHLLVPNFSNVKSYQCKLCQLDKHTCTNYGPRVNKRVALEFMFSHNNCLIMF